jgi:hypothetical protein
MALFDGESKVMRENTMSQAVAVAGSHAVESTVTGGPTGG